jgi:hypothetical protein
MDTMKDCTVYKTLTIIGKKWTLLILFELDRGSAPYKRFNELRAALDTITPKVLVSAFGSLRTTASSCGALYYTHPHHERIRPHESARRSSV